MEFLSLLHKCGLSYAILGISIPSPKTRIVICNFWNFFPFSINVDYHMQVSRIPFPSPKMWTIVCNFWNFFPFSINMDYHMQVLRNPFPSPKMWTIICNIWYFFSYPKNKDYHMQFLEFLSLLHKCGLSYESFKNSHSFSKNVEYNI